jgi:hypothetical protein
LARSVTPTSLMPGSSCQLAMCVCVRTASIMAAWRASHRWKQPRACGVSRPRYLQMQTFSTCRNDCWHDSSHKPASILMSWLTACALIFVWTCGDASSENPNPGTANPPLPPMAQQHVILSENTTRRNQCLQIYVEQRMAHCKVLRLHALYCMKKSQEVKSVMADTTYAMQLVYPCEHKMGYAPIQR